jgi:prefoldin subunit 5
MNKKKTQRKIAATQETIAVIERDMKELKDKLKTATKLKGEERRTAIFKLERTEIRNMSNLLMSLENSIYAQEDEDEFHSHD